MRQSSVCRFHCKLLANISMVGLLICLALYLIISEDSKIVHGRQNTKLRQVTRLDLEGKRSPQQYDLRVIAMVFNRPNSLLRLLNSVNAAEYYNDRIKVEVWIDRSKNGSLDEGVVQAALDFQFDHGDYSVHAHPRHVGIYGQWLNAWTPVENSSEIALIVEDDIQVSPLFYRYLKAVHNKYDDYPKINGFALQGFSGTLSAAPKGHLKAPYEHPVFLYPILGCWGFSPSKRNWKKFLEWAKPAIKEGKVKPYVPETILTYWYINDKRNSVWEMWHVYHAWMNKEMTLYCNLKDHEGFTANWREAGLHFKDGEGGTGTSSNPLVTTWKPAFDNLPDRPVVLNLDSQVIHGAN